MAYECVARPSCPGCGTEWDDEMVMLFDAVMGLGCGCCPPIPVEQLPDIVCHSCKKVLLSARGKAETSGTSAELDMSPRN